MADGNRMTLRSIHDRWLAFARTSWGKRFIRFGRGAFIASVIGLLVYQVSGIGWGEVLRSLPTQPLFYVLLLAMYLLLPFMESVIYGRLWRLRLGDCLPVMIRKRVLNIDVIGYSGEVYFFAWAGKRLTLPRRQIMSTIKDNLILSSGASIAAAVLLLAGLTMTGLIRPSQFIENPNPIYVGVGLFCAALIGALVFRFRHAIFSLPRRVLAAIGVTHLSRFFVGYAMQIAQWWIVLPLVSFETWAVLLTLLVLINRIPFLPSSDLVFVAAGAGITPLLDVPVAPVVGMLLVRSAVDRLLNIVLFTATVWRERQAVYKDADLAESSEGGETSDIRNSTAEMPV